jgi:phosphohistidine phosphatase SixA
VILLVRHASAGERELWEGDDSERPLDDRGVRQAGEIAELLASFEPTTIVSSPALRCRQTMAPLAEALSIPVELRDELSEARQDDDGAAFVASLAGDTVVVCGHGGLEQLVLGHTAPRWRKATTFVLDDDLHLIERLKLPK